MKCSVLSNEYRSVDCLKEECALGWDKETKQCVFIAIPRIAKALEKIANRINVQIAR